MSHSNPVLKVVAITQETADAITIHLEHPDKTPIPYKAGQFLTLIVPINGRKERRAYSLCSTPAEQPRLSVTVKRVPNGRMSNYLLNQLKVGDTMEVLEPMGNFCICPAPDNTRTVVLIGAGSGITPLMSIAKAVLQEETKSRLLLIYGNRNENTVIFKDQLKQLEQHYPDRLVVEHVYSQPLDAAEVSAAQKSGNSFLGKLFGKAKSAAPVVVPEVQAGTAYTGRLNRSLLIKILEKHNLVDFLDTQYYMCGPEGLMDEVKQALKILHVPAGQIFKESFVSSGHNAADAAGEVTDDPGDGEIRDQVVTILYEGSEYKVEVSKEETILAAALSKDIDLPFSCQAGLCTACRGKCLSGKVHLDEREGLSDAEMAEGYVLTCVGHPLTKDVVIEIG